MPRLHGAPLNERQDRNASGPHLLPLLLDLREHVKTSAGENDNSQFRLAARAPRPILVQLAQVPRALHVVPEDTPSG